MTMHFSPTYGVFLLDQNEWRQISEHGRLQLAEERAHEAHAIMGSRVRIRSSDGVVFAELEERRARPRSLPGRPNRMIGIFPDESTGAR